MKGFIKFVLAFLIPIASTWYASTKNIPYLTWGVLAATSALMLFIFRANILMYIGIIFYRRKSVNTAVKFMRMAYKTRKLSPSHQLIYAYIILRNGELDEAETIMNKAAVMGKHALREDEYKAIDFNRALIIWKKGDLSQAIVQLEELYAGGYCTSALYGSLGSFYLLNKEYYKALELSQSAIDSKRIDPVILDNLGQSYIGLGELDKALAVYERLIPQKPHFLEAYYNYATILEKKDMLSKAKRYYEIALTFDEKFLSTVTTDQICEAIERVDNISIENVNIADIVYEGTTEPIEFDSTKELSSIEDVEIDVSVPSASSETNSEETLKDESGITAEEADNEVDASAEEKTAPDTKSDAN